MPNEFAAIAAVEERCEGIAAADVCPARDAANKAIPNKVLFTKEQIAAKTAELGEIIARDFADKRPLLAPILKGGFIFAADLLRALSPSPAGTTVEFISAASYGTKTETSGTVEVSFDAAAFAGRHVLLVDDLVDSGLTLATVHARLLTLDAPPASVASAVLLDKAARRVVEYAPDYVGFDCPNQWVSGAGMDTCQMYRGLSDVVALSPDAIAAATGGGGK